MALEAVLLKAFPKPHQVLERKIIQSNEFRVQVLPAWAQYAMNTKIAYTPFNIAELLRVRVCFH